MAHVGYRYSIEWGNPYTAPPDRKPRVIAEMFETIEQRSRRMKNGGRAFPAELASLHQLGDGYFCTTTAICTPHKSLTKESLAEVRLKRLKRRIQKKYPLFADQFIAEAIENKPEYYAGETDPEILKARDEAIHDEEVSYQRFLKAVQGEEKHE